jgi:glycosyltransferase involved in cell wall biosynthesis
VASAVVRLVTSGTVRAGQGTTDGGSRPPDRLDEGDETVGAHPEPPAEGTLHVVVVTVAAAGIGGMQQHTHDLVRGLVAEGHEVDVFCPAGPGLAENLHGARWTLLEPSDRNDAAWERQLAEAYAASSARRPVDVVHSESTAAAALARRGIPAPIVVMYHGNFLGLAKAHVRRAVAGPFTAPSEFSQLARLSWTFFRHRNAWAMRSCRTLVVSRQQVADTARSIRVPESRIEVVPNGVDTTVFRPRDREPLRRRLRFPDGLVLVAVGRLNREKGFDVAIDALAQLAHHEPPVSLVVVGDGEERESLAARAGRRGVADRTVFAGGVPQDTVAEYLAAADVFVFPTRRDEAGPLVLPQAMASGLPVVASRIGGIPEVVAPVDGPPAGLLVRPGDVDGLVQAVVSLAADEQVRERLGGAARARAVEEYSLGRMTARTVAVYRAAIADRDPGSGG